MNNVNEFKNLWKLERMKVLHGFSSLVEEELILEEVSTNQVNCDKVLKDVFLVTRNFALNFVQQQNKTLGVLEIKDFLNKLEIPCLGGKAQSGNDNIYQFKRNSCYRTNLNRFSCEYWRENIDALVMGLGDEARYSRHESLSSHGKQCVDVLFDDSQLQNYFAKLDNEQNKIFDEVFELAHKLKLDCKLKGIQENKIFYFLESKSNQPCAQSTHLLQDFIKSKFKTKFPHIDLVEISPKAVL